MTAKKKPNPAVEPTRLLAPRFRASGFRSTVRFHSKKAGDRSARISPIKPWGKENMKTDMVGYYAKRAGEYEQVYAKPERQADVRRLREQCASVFRDHNVLEVSCGTGYWTEAIAQTARAVVACDINPEVLAIARSKDWAGAPVKFIEADSYALPELERDFSAGFSGFWWSHIPKKRIRSFLDGFHAKLCRGALVMFIDNRYVEGSSTPVFRTDVDGDSFQQRRLGDGSLHEVLKNFPMQAELLAAVTDFAQDADVTLMHYFWILRYRVK